MELFERAGKIHIDLTDSPTLISSRLRKSYIYPRLVELGHGQEVTLSIGCDTNNNNAIICNFFKFHKNRYESFWSIKNPGLIYQVNIISE